MNAGTKILLGAGATALLAWGLHGPLGRGAAFMQTLQKQSRLALDQRGLRDVTVRFADNPFSRTAQLSGPDADLIERSDAQAVLAGVRGTGGLHWIDGAPPPAGAPSAPVAAKPSPAATQAAGPAPAPAPSATPAARPSPAAAPTPTPTPTPALAAAPAAPQAAGGCQSQLDAALNRRVMRFRSGSAWLNPQSQAMIADAAGALKRCKGYAVEIGGHTDSHGNEAVNRAMSQERANRVRDALVAQGIPAAAVTARGYGSSRPIKAGNAADPANRRISFTVVRGGN